MSMIRATSAKQFATPERKLVVAGYAHLMEIAEGLPNGTDAKFWVNVPSDVCRGSMCVIVYKKYDSYDKAWKVRLAIVPDSDNILDSPYWQRADGNENWLDGHSYTNVSDRDVLWFLKTYGQIKSRLLRLVDEGLVDVSKFRI